MAKFDLTNAQFEEIDKNRDGIIDKKEFHKWAPGAEGQPYSSYKSSTSRFYRNSYSTSRFNENKYRTNYTNASEYMADEYASYGTTAVASDRINDKVIHTSSPEETDEYLKKIANIYKDPNPQIIRRTIERPVMHEQRVFLRYLRPPVPEPGTLTIKEVRPLQPRPLSPLIIREQSAARSSPPPLILRERPPTPPPPVPDEIITHRLPTSPVQSRSVIIERFPSPPEKP
ncbi:unnamed protein product, partial [Rotaria sordida]